MVTLRRNQRTGYIWPPNRDSDLKVFCIFSTEKLPSLPESYVHRIGRTGRAGRRGCAITLCDAEQRAWLHDVEREIGRALTVQDDHPWHSEAARNSTMRPPVLGGAPVKAIQPQKMRERKVWTEEEKRAARAAATAADRKCDEIGGSGRDGHLPNRGDADLRH